jgi:hypothetical protein
MSRSSSILFKTRHFIALTRKDADAFSDALRAHFPMIRFLRAKYWEPWIDREAWRERSRLKDLGKLPQESPSLVMRHPGRDPLPYLSSLGDALYLTTGWIEPEGWRPEWSASPNREGIYTIINEPGLRFEFTRSSYLLWRERRAFDEPPDTFPEDEILVLYCDRIWARYTREDKEQQAFLRKVWRILDKHTTTKLAYCDHRTLEPKGIAGVRDVWVGFDALEWARRDKRHYFRDSGTFYRPAECFRPEKGDRP